MNNLLEIEFQRLQELFHSVNRPFPNTNGVKDLDLERVFQLTGIQLTGGIADFYKQINGSNREEVLAVFSDEPASCEFNSIDSALSSWGGALSDIDEYYRNINKEWSGYEQTPPRDIRIKKELWVNKLWFPFAEFNGGSTRVYWDADPAPTGVMGQIIVYQHDPEGIYYVAPDFESFMKKSNDLFEQNRRVLLERIFD